MPLERFARSVHDDPLVAAEGMDTAAARRALDLIEAASHGLQEELAKRSLAHRLFLLSHPIGTHAIPTPFLRALCDAEDARAAFVRDIRLETAENLVAAWARAHRALKTCVGRYRFLHTVALRIYLGDSQLVYEDDFQNTSTVADILRVLELFEQNVARLGEDIAARRRLLAGETIRVPARAAIPAPPARAERPWEPQYERMLELAERDFASQWLIEEKHMVRHAVAVFDGTPTTHTFALYLLKDRHSDRRRMKVSLADEYLFFTLLGPEADFGPIGDAIYRSLIDRGIPYWYQDPALFYTTREQVYWADVATIVDRERRPELSAQLEVQKSSLFHLILHAYADMVFSWTRIFQTRARNGDMSYSLLYGLLSRSNPALLFMPFNGSVWRISEQPNFIGSGRSERGMYRYASEVLDTLSPQELELVMRGPSIRRAAWREEAERLLHGS